MLTFIHYFTYVLNFQVPSKYKYLDETKKIVGQNHLKFIYMESYISSMLKPHANT